jgi:hypothetical protein
MNASTVLYLLLIVIINIVCSGRWWSLLLAEVISIGIVLIISWRLGELSTYSGWWYVLVWSFVLAMYCCVVWTCSWVVRRRR